MDAAGPSTATAAPEASDTPAPLSKNAQKRAMRAAAAAETKTERRRLEKQRRKARAAQRRQEAEAKGEPVPPARRQKRLPQHQKTLHGAGVCIDLAFDELMTDKVRATKRRVRR
jgi:tRNA (guanine9-N1)-methyltransferase